MVEILASNHDDDGIPWVHATYIESYDADGYVTANAVPSPLPPPVSPIISSSSSSSSSSSDRLSLDPSPPPSPLLSTVSSSQTIPGEPHHPEAPRSGRPETNPSLSTSAGIAAGILGFLCGGPILGIFFGFGAAYAAATKEGAVGDVARAIGEVGLVAKAKAQEVDERHKLVDKSKVAAAKYLEDLQDADRKHRILEKLKRFVIWSWEATLDYARRHHLVERGLAAVENGLDRLLEKISEENNQIRNESTRRQHRT